MSENNRNPIEKCRKKLSQFTTMNVIDGQASLVIYASLIFYSLTIDNILNIIVLLILAGVSIAMLTGENGILTQANQAKNEMNNKTIEEKIQIAVTGAKTIDKGYMELNFNNFTQELESQFGKDKVTVRENQNGSFEVVLKENNKVYNVTKTGEIKQGLNWEEIMQNVMPPADQTNKNVIGIGTNGQTVNMDFWKFGYDVVTNGYGLNSKEVLQNTGCLLF